MNSHDNNDILRAEFEAAMVALGYPENEFEGFMAEGSHAYYSPKANMMLDAWQAARRQHGSAAQAVEPKRRDIFAICDAYESGICHGLQRDGHKSGAIFGNPECGMAYEIGYEEGEERSSGKKPAAPIDLINEQERRIAELEAALSRRPAAVTEATELQQELEDFDIERTGDERYDASNFLLNAAQEFWRACHNAGQYGGVQWLTGTGGELLIYTRGEYRDQLMRNIAVLDCQKEHKFPPVVAAEQPAAAGNALTDGDIEEFAERMEASDPKDSFWKEFARLVEQHVCAEPHPAIVAHLERHIDQLKAQLAGAQTACDVAIKERDASLRAAGKDGERYEYLIDCDYRAAKKYLPNLDEAKHKQGLRSKHDAAMQQAASNSAEGAHGEAK